MGRLLSELKRRRFITKLLWSDASFLKKCVWGSIGICDGVLCGGRNQRKSWVLRYGENQRRLQVPRFGGGIRPIENFWEISY